MILCSLLFSASLLSCVWESAGAYVRLCTFCVCMCVCVYVWVCLRWLFEGKGGKESVCTDGILWLTRVVWQKTKRYQIRVVYVFAKRFGLRYVRPMSRFSVKHCVLRYIGVEFHFSLIAVATITVSNTNSINMFPYCLLFWRQPTKIFIGKRRRCLHTWWVSFVHILPSLCLSSSLNLFQAPSLPAAPSLPLFTKERVGTRKVPVGGNF